MRAVVIFKEETDYARQVYDYLRDFERQTGKSLETLNPESGEGISFCETYDILEYPTIIALSNEGTPLNQWRGLPLPTISEVSFYV
jgi:hypothetical protein